LKRIDETYKYLTPRKMKQSKAERLKNHLRNKKTITSWEAFQLFQITRLASNIFKLKARGWIFNTTTGEANGSRYAIYELVNVPS